jgi:hypothetical protein
LAPAVSFRTTIDATIVSVKYALSGLRAARSTSLVKAGGLSQTGADGRLVFATGASPGAAVQRANLLQTGDQAVDAGLITADDLTTFLRVLDDPGFTFTMPLLISGWGRRQAVV